MNNMSSKIKHSGVIDDISEKCVKVRILQTSACAHCKIAGHCNSTDSKEKVIDIYNVPDSWILNTGDQVVVTATTGMAANALLLSFGIPLIIMIAALIIINILTSDETFAALGSIVALAPYYAVLYMNREKLKSKITFEIER